MGIPGVFGVPQKGRGLTQVDRGLEADQKVIAAHGCYAMTATTALTAQNTLGVVDIHGVPSGFVRKLIEACIVDIGVDVVKTGRVLSGNALEGSDGSRHVDFGRDD